MKNIKWIMGLLMVLMVPLFAQSTVETLYQNGKYEEAYQYYYQDLQKNPRNADTLYNLGNVLYKLKKPGKAILFYKKALKLKPGFSDARHNIDIVQATLIDKMQPSEFTLNVRVRNGMAHFSWSTLSVLFLLSVLGVNVILLLWTRDRKTELNKNLFGVLVGVALVMALFLYAKFRCDLVQEGVILAEKVEVKSGPNQTLPTSFMVHEGMVFDVVEETSGWIQIRLFNGLTGWVPRGTYGTI